VARQRPAYEKNSLERVARIFIPCLDTTVRKTTVMIILLATFMSDSPPPVIANEQSVMGVSHDDVTNVEFVY